MTAYNLMNECLHQKPLPEYCFSKRNRELVQKIQNGDNESFAELVLNNGRLIINIMKQYVPNCMHKEYTDDLFQQGVLGLHRAAITYDCNAPTVFSTYAYDWIRHYITRYSMKNQILRASLTVMSKAIAVNRFIATYQSEHSGDMPDDNTICKEIGISHKILQEIYSYSKNVLSLDATISSFGEESEMILLDMVAAPDGEVDKNMIRQELNMLLLSLVDKETKGNSRNYHIVTSYFGLNGEEPLTYKQLSELHGISYERVRQIVETVVLRLQKPKNLQLLNVYTS